MINHDYLGEGLCRFQVGWTEGLKKLIEPIVG